MQYTSPHVTVGVAYGLLNCKTCLTPVFYLMANVKETLTVHIQRWIAIPVEWLWQCVHEKGRCLTSGIAASKCEISCPDDGGIHATKTCRSKGDHLRNLGSHSVKNCALLLVFFSEQFNKNAWLKQRSEVSGEQITKHCLKLLSRNCWHCMPEETALAWLPHHQAYCCTYTDNESHFPHSPV
jgi:hypothetical protein